jgi:hypothetical protein
MAIRTGRLIAALAVTVLLLVSTIFASSPAFGTPTASLTFLASTKHKVTVPSNYVYNPKLGTLHDYCTHAPDEFPAPFAKNADFRGPCARHDLCYGTSAKKSTCDNALKANLYNNCDYYYGTLNPLRYACRATAAVYWAVVVAWTHKKK